MTLSWYSVVYSRFVKCLYLTCGVALALVGVLAAGYACRVGVSQFRYYRLKYGDCKSVPADEKQGIAESAHVCYSWNYYLCELMADAFWSRSQANHDGDRDKRLYWANTWCSRGRTLNPYGRKLTWLATALAEGNAPADAVVIWKAYVDRVFWDPWNLSSLVQLKARADMVDQARALLPLLKGRAAYQTAAAAVDAAGSAPD